MESLAVMAALVFLTVLASGPLAYLATNTGYVYVGGLLGLFALVVGLWFSSVMRLGVGWVGLASAAIGAWCLLQAYRRDSTQ